MNQDLDNVKTTSGSWLIFVEVIFDIAFWTILKGRFQFAVANDLTIPCSFLPFQPEYLTDLVGNIKFLKE